MGDGLIIAAVVMVVTIIGLPWTRAAFNIPPAVRPESRVTTDYCGGHDLATRPRGFVCNILWLVLAGWWLALGDLITAIVQAITIVRIPFDWAHVKTRWARALANR